MPDLAAYLQRLSFLLRQGEPANDVALYLPTGDAYAGFSPGHVSVSERMRNLIGPGVIPAILDAGYNFDFIDDAIQQSGAACRILILPAVERIPLATLRAIDRYAAKGGVAIAIGRAPSLTPGLIDGEIAEIRALSKKLFPKILDEKSLGRELHRVLPADVAADPAIGFVHRKTSDADLYFLVNTSNRRVNTEASFRQTSRGAQWWDPISGKVTAAGNGRIRLNLAPYESRVLVFSGKPAAVPRLARALHGRSIDLSADWKLTIGGVSRNMVTLASWTDEPEWNHFSGQAVYEKSVVLAPSGRAMFLTFGEGTPVAVGSEHRAGSGMRAWLENPVRESAVVFVNGKRAGSVWCPPYQIEVTSLIRSGENTIRIVVGNLAVNAMAAHPPDDSRLKARYGERFEAQDMDQIKSLPGGLLGPVRLEER